MYRGGGDVWWRLVRVAAVGGCCLKGCLVGLCVGPHSVQLLSY